MPTDQALQVFYGTVPLILVLVAAILQMHRDAKTQQVLLKDILDRLGRIEAAVTDQNKRITVLEAAKWR
jgi:hypothetical protein